MAEETNHEREETRVARKPISLIVLALVGLVAGGAGFATPYVVPGIVETQGEGDEEAVVDIAKPSGEIAFIQFGESVVNLNEGRMTKYLRLVLTLQVDEAQEEQITMLVEERKAILRDWLLRYLSDKDLESIRGAAGQNRMRREIMDQFNTMLFPDGYDRIDDVLFEEFAVQ